VVIGSFFPRAARCRRSPFRDPFFRVDLPPSTAFCPRRSLRFFLRPLFSHIVVTTSCPALPARPPRFGGAYTLLLRKNFSFIMSKPLTLCPLVLLEHSFFFLVFFHCERGLALLVCRPSASGRVPSTTFRPYLPFRPFLPPLSQQAPYELRLCASSPFTPDLYAFPLQSVFFRTALQLFLAGPPREDRLRPGPREMVSCAPFSPALLP